MFCSRYALLRNRAFTPNSRTPASVPKFRERRRISFRATNRFECRGAAANRAPSTTTNARTLLAKTKARAPSSAHSMCAVLASSQDDRPEAEAEADHLKEVPTKPSRRSRSEASTLLSGRFVSKNTCRAGANLAPAGVPVLPGCRRSNLACTLRWRNCPRSRVLGQGRFGP